MTSATRCGMAVELSLISACLPDDGDHQGGERGKQAERLSATCDICFSSRRPRRANVRVEKELNFHTPEMEPLLILQVTTIPFLSFLHSRALSFSCQNGVGAFVVTMVMGL